MWVEGSRRRARWQVRRQRSPALSKCLAAMLAPVAALLTSRGLGAASTGAPAAAADCAMATSVRRGGATARAGVRAGGAAAVRSALQQEGWGAHGQCWIFNGGEAHDACRQADGPTLRRA